jgi:nitrate/TMAO reductase-like tetraheme cytochrome c subunit
MNEEQKKNKSHSFYSGKLFKILTLTLFFIIVLFSVGFLGLETTSSSKFCSSCHEMKPEYYTWKASSHSEVDCVNCHTGSTKEDYAKAKANGLVQVYKKATQTYAAPIKMPDLIPDSACEKCHNLSNRDVTPTGDIIIPHDQHKEKEVGCIQCHKGIAHGSISDRKMTFQTDYDRWDDSVGKRAMSDMKFIKPEMASCIECHKARKITTECKACHTSGMIPNSHKDKNFKTETHGMEAKSDLKTCNQCHKDMSREALQGYEEPTTLDKFMRQNHKIIKNYLTYAKENTFCQDCHSKRPASHDNKFFNNHGTIASDSQENCVACHDVKKLATPSKNEVNCSTCHPSSHSQNENWQERHPIPVDGIKRPSETCYECHSKNTCSTCHKD